MRYHKRLLCLPALFAAVRLMSPPAHLMLRGLPQRVASLEPAWHTARRQRHIHAAECLRTAQSCQPVKADAMAEPPAHILATGQGNHSPPLGWLHWRHAELRPRSRVEGEATATLSMSAISRWHSGGVAPLRSPWRRRPRSYTDATSITGVARLQHQPKSANQFYKPAQCFVKCHCFV